MTKEDWLKQNAMEIAALDKVMDILKMFRDAAAISSYPGGLGDFGIRKKQTWDYQDGMEDCGK